MSNNTFSATGGGGAGYKALIRVDELGTYSVTVGSGGRGRGANKGASPTGVDATASTLKNSSNVTLISAGGGTGGKSGPNWATRGSGGTLSRSSSLREVEVYLSKNGNNGNSYAGGSAPTVNGAAGPISGHTWGASGSAKGNYNGGRVNASYHGYASLKLVNPYYNLVFYVSQDGLTWEEVGTREVSSTEDDISIELQYRYRYVKIEISGNDNLQSKLSFKYIRNDISSSSQVEIPCKMHEFIYNNEDKYLLVFVDEKVQIFKDDTLVQIVTASGLLKQYIRDVKVAYKDDTIILTHPEMPVKQLQRQSNGTWVWSNLSIKNTPYYAFGGETSTTKSVGITPSALEGTVKITADSAVFDSGYVGQYIDGNGGRVRITEYTSTTVVKGVTIIPFYTTDKITSWKYITGYEAVWSAQRGYPTTCLFAQQRLWFGGSKSLPSHIWASRLDDYNNFKNSGNYDNDSIDVTMLTNNKILNLVEQRGIHIFTSGDEWTIQEGTYTPDKITITKNTANGSDDIKPEIIGGSVCFIEKNGRSLLSYVYNYDQASFMTENISLFSNLIKKPVAFDVEVNSAKDRADFIYIVLQDGTMLSGCVLLDQNIISISKFVTNGLIKDVCCVLEDVYLLVERNNTVCLEKLVDDKTDCVRQVSIVTNEVDGLYRYDNKDVYVYTDNTSFGKYTVYNGKITLDTVPNETCNIGIAYDFCLESNPIAINGKTTNIKKRISKATITCKDTKELEFNGQIKQSKDDIFDFYSCTKYGNDVRFIIKGEFKPIEILSVLLNINYEG